MSKSNWTIIKQIELLNEYIADECSEYLYYQPKYNSQVFEKIKNASALLVSNAMRILRNQNALIYTEEKKILTVENTKEILFRIYQIILQAEIPINKENKIRKMMKNDFKINPEKILQNNQPRTLQEARNKMLLNGY